MTLQYREMPESGAIELKVQGYVSRADYDSVIDRIQAFIDQNESIKVIEIVESFSGFDPSVLMPGLRFDILNMSRVSHVAVVSDIGWISPIVKAAGVFMSTKLRLFHLDDLEKAQSWIADPADDSIAM